jgi:hypothetical protein
VIAFRIIVAVLALASIAAVLASVLRTVVLPRAVPARLARLVFLSVRSVLQIRLRLIGRSDYRTRDRVFALQAPLGVFAQLFTWGGLNLLCFAALFWSLDATRLSGDSLARAIELSGSSMFTLGFDPPRGLLRHIVSFTDAGVGLTLFALVISYLPSLYSAFSRREALITKLVVRTGSPPSGPQLLIRTWELDRFDRLEEVWDPWEDWFIDLGESHTTFPQLGFFRSPHPRNHWVLAAETVLDAAAVRMTVCDVPHQSRSELCLEAGIDALSSIARFLGIPDEPPEEEAEILLSQDQFTSSCQTMADRGIPIRPDSDAAWRDFRRMRARYEPLIAVLGAMTDAPRSEWSSWTDNAPRHSPPLLRIHRR